MHNIFTLVFVFLLSFSIQAQPPICGPGAEMSPTCGGACVICDIDGFTGTNEGVQGALPLRVTVQGLSITWNI